MALFNSQPIATLAPYYIDFHYHSVFQIPPNPLSVVLLLELLPQPQHILSTFFARDLQLKAQKKSTLG